MLTYKPKVPPRPSAAQAAANGRKGKAASPWNKAPHVAELKNYRRMRAWQTLPEEQHGLTTEGDDNGL